MLPTRAAAIELDRTGTIGEAAARIIASGYAHLQANVAGVLTDEDPEYLHQMRVAVRRLRSCLTVCAHALAPEPVGALRVELRWLGRRLGPARDWDVFLAELLPPFAAALDDSRSVATLTGEARARRDKASRAVCVALKSRRFRRLAHALGRIDSTALSPRDGSVDDAVLPFATRLLERRLQRVYARGRGVETRGVEQLHALRIAVKKLRYAVEFFASLYPEAKTRRFRSELVSLQDTLGAINDASMFPRFVNRVVPPASALRERARGRSAQRIAIERERLRSQWRGFRRRRAFWL